MIEDGTMKQDDKTLIEALACALCTTAGADDEDWVDYVDGARRIIADVDAHRAATADPRDAEIKRLREAVAALVRAFLDSRRIWHSAMKQAKAALAQPEEPLKPLGHEFEAVYDANVNNLYEP